MRREHFEIRETAVTLIAETEHIKVAKDAIFEARDIIEMKIAEDPFFQITYDPYRQSNNDDDLIKRMCQASVLANVGPMASVAGAVAVYAVERMRDAGATYAVAENGGDIAILADRPVLIGLYSGDPKLDTISVRIPPSENITGVCSSSGRIGPSVSFGDSDISTVFSDDVILADATATRLGNLTGSMTVSEAMETVGSISGIKGCMIYRNSTIGMFGDIPELVKTHIPEKNITRILFS